MGFFKKLFRRRKKKDKKELGAFLPGTSKHNHGHSQVHHNQIHSHDDVKRIPAFNSSSNYSSFQSPELVSHGSDSKSGRSRGTRGSRSKDNSSYGSSFDSRDDHNRVYHHGQQLAQAQNRAEERFDDPNTFHADFADFNNESNGFGSKRPNTLNYEQVQKFEQQTAHQRDRLSSNPYGQPPPKKLQLKRMSNGQLVAMEEMKGSSPLSASSDFDLSTDAEDNEYNRIRYENNGNLAPMLESPASASEEEGVPFPGSNGKPVRSPGTTQTGPKRENSLYLSMSESEFSASAANNRSKHYFSDSDHELTSPASKASTQVSPPTKGPSPRSPKQALTTISQSQSQDSSKGNGNSKSSKFTFEAENGENDDDNENGASTISGGAKSEELSVLSPRTMVIQQAQRMRYQGKLDSNMYPDSSTSESESVQKNGSKVSPSKLGGSGSSSGDGPSNSEGIIENFVDFENNAFGDNKFQASSSKFTTSKSVADTPSPVTELLAQAKERRSRRGNSAASVSSAPNTNEMNNRRNVPKPNKNSSSSAREKLQKRRKEKKEWLQSNGGESDDESDNGKENESWLYNEVQGALGPQGIQADLESLGERSHRSRTSVGNRSVRSYKSHHSRRSQRSSNRRKPRSSDESVGSRHSRGSRASRASRYSIKSTKSHLSQMSAESRSVANDLIRLEMQLAMVGGKTGENTMKKELQEEARKKGITGLVVGRGDGGSVGGNSNGGRSYSSRSRVAIPKKVKTSIKAPPGKLGIILANKNDAKGTVVSGVRTTSILADKISPGDRIVAIDGEDVSRMSVTEITAIMSRKSDYDRMLTVLKSAKYPN